MLNLCCVPHFACLLHQTLVNDCRVGFVPAAGGGCAHGVPFLPAARGDGKGASTGEGSEIIPPTGQGLEQDACRQLPKEEGPAKGYLPPARQSRRGDPPQAPGGRQARPPGDGMQTAGTVAS